MSPDTGKDTGTPPADLAKLDLLRPHTGLPVRNCGQRPIMFTPERRDYLRQQLRLLGDFGIDAHGAYAERTAWAAGVAAELGLATCSVTVTVKPWGSGNVLDWGPGGLPPTVWDERSSAWRQYFRDRLADVAGWIAEASRLSGVGLAVDTVAADMEHWQRAPEALRASDPAAALDWDESLRLKCRLAEVLIREAFPIADTIWYGLGQVYGLSHPDGWQHSRLFPESFRPAAGGYSVSLYGLANWARSVEAYERTLLAARAAGIDEVTPWLRLGGGQVDSLDSRAELFDHDYPRGMSWQAGAALHNPAFWAIGRRLPYPTSDFRPVRRLLLWPGAGHEKNPSFWHHLAAFLAGAAGNKDPRLLD